MKLQMTEVQKAYLLGRNETFDGKTGTHMYLEMSYKGSIKQFELAFNYLIEKQPMLRAKVESFGYFEILPEYSYEIEVTECSTDNIEEVKSQKRQNLSQKLYRRDDFPFYTIEALSITESEYENIILFSIDLLIADGMSLFYLFDCLNKLLNNELDNGFYLEDRTVELMEINEAYLKEKVSNRYLKDKEYWQNKILDLPASPSLLLHEENAINSKFSRKEFNFSEKELLKLQKIAQERDISLSTLLLTLYGITLRRWSELDEFTINMTTFKRPRKNKKYLEVIGDFTSTTLVDLNINLNQSVIENTRSAHHKVFQAMKHSKFEGVEVLRELGKSNKSNSITLLIQDNQIIDTNQIPLEKVPKDELYSIFTSGTTGEPKGISISEAAVLNTIDDIIERTSLSREDTIFNVSNLTFDLSVFDLLAPLVIGCSTYLSSDIDLKKHREQIIQSSFWNSTPGLVQLLLNEIDIENSKLRNILMSGDFISSQLVQDIEKKFINKDINIFSLGGATEASIWSIYFPLNNFDGHKIPYGYPLSNQAFYVVDFEDNLVNMNTLGELVISGKGVANGYINNKDSTSVFYKHPKLGYIYKTGDKGYLASDGKLYITGRMKSEMKLNGYRIDLVEIQNSLLLDDCIDKAKVVIEKNSNGKDYLIAYCVSSEPEISGSEIRNRMKDHLPSYMIPTSFVFIESFPLTNNGKIDMRQLKNLYLNYHKEQELNDKEKELLSVWKEVLDIDSNDVSRMSTFFELGGDSIKLPELLYLINQKYGVSLSIEELLNKFTLHEQAQYIEELVNLINKSTIRLNKNIVQLKKGTSNKNVILIHAGSGEIGIYNNLSKNIDDTYNVYAIKFDKDTNVLHPRTLELDELAKLYNSYLEVFENIEILGGWCIGGTIGYEICKFNKKVKNLLLINSLPPVDKKEHVFDFTLFSERNLIYQSFGYKDTKANNLLELWEDVVSTIEGNSRLLESLISIVPRELSRLIPFFGENNPNPKELIYYINLFRSFELARKIYQSDFIINQNIYYLGASKEQVENYQKWKTLSKGEWNEGLVSGDHTTIFDKDNVAMMAEYINEVK